MIWLMRERQIAARTAADSALLAFPEMDLEERYRELICGIDSPRRQRQIAVWLIRALLELAVVRGWRRYVERGIHRTMRRGLGPRWWLHERVWWAVELHLIASERYPKGELLRHIASLRCDGAAGLAPPSKGIEYSRGLLTAALRAADQPTPHAR